MKARKFGHGRTDAWFGASSADLDPEPREGVGRPGAVASGGEGVTALWQVLSTFNLIVPSAVGLYLLASGFPAFGLALVAIAPFAALVPATMVVLLNRSAKIEAALTKMANGRRSGEASPPPA